jgi:outer membrane protein assembly factor BamB
MGYSAEAQPIVYEGVIYVPTGEDDVYAVSVETGDILWEHEGNLDQKINTVCCGWLSRGVAIGDGKVYLGKLDGTLVAYAPILYSRAALEASGRSTLVEALVSRAKVVSEEPHL